MQDNSGFLWFGTQYGLNRFDGYTFKVFVHDPNNPGSLSGVAIQALFKDRDGALWIGCEQSLDRLDAKTETFTQYPMPMIHYISQDHAGLLWVSTANGLYRLDQQSGSIRVYTHDAGDPESLPDNDVRSASEDQTGRFWVAEPDGMYEFDRASGHVKLHIPIHNPSREFSFHEDRFGGFWIFYGSGSGLAKFDRERNVLTYYSFHANDTSSAAYSGVTAMLEDRYGNLWLATQGSGLVKFDREHHRFISYTHGPGDSDSLAENRVTTLLEDREGSIWLALFGSGLQRFSPVPAAFQAVSIKPKQGGIGCFYEDSHRNLWIGTRPALYRIDASGRSTAFVGGKPGMPFDVISVVEDRAGFIWVGTFNNGLFRFDPKVEQWKNYRHNKNDSSSLSNDIVNRLLVDHDGTLWAATWDGLNRFDAHTGGFTTFRADPRNRELMYLALAEGTHHDLWLGTLGFGLQHFAPKTTQFATIGNSDGPGGLSDNEVNTIHIARTGALWLATQNGLDEFDPATGHLNAYSARDGLANSAISCVLEDSSGMLWMSTGKGISSFDPSTKTFRNFSEADGLPGPEMGGWGACLRSQSGQMFFAGFSGATTFLPEAVHESTYVPPIVITDFRLLGNSKSSAAQAIHLSANWHVSDIILSHNQTPFSLTFAALGYSNPQTNRYRYMLEGLDDRWNEVGSDSRSVTYTSLPAGKYHFRVQGATNGGRWSDPGAGLQIIILPPWWGTWWFRTAYVSAAVLVVWSLYRYRIHQIARQSDIRIDAQVNERTRIAQELHDTLLQGFMSASMQLSVANRQLPADLPSKVIVADVLEQMKNVIEEGRSAIRGMRLSSTNSDDLEPAFLRMPQDLAVQERMNFKVIVEGQSRPLHPLIRDEVYRIGREAVANAFHHANASAIEAEIEYADNQLRVVVRDNGCGIDPETLKSGRDGHWGLSGMRERARVIGAGFKIWSNSAAGTEVELVVPGQVAYRASSGKLPARWLTGVLRRDVRSDSENKISP